MRVPNALLSADKLINRSTDQVSLTGIKALKTQLKSQCSAQCKNVFYMVKQKKNQQRSMCTKEYQTYQAQVAAELTEPNQETIERIMRCFRVKLVNRFVQQTLVDVYLDA